MLQKIKYTLSRLLVVDCTGCGSLMVHKKGLCLQCETEVSQKFKTTACATNHVVGHSHLQYRCLFAWYPCVSDTLSNYVYLLKSPLAEYIWDRIAEDFVLHHRLSIKTDVVFVPIPSSQGRKHSVYFAFALAKILNGKVYQALSLPSWSQQQKAKSKAQREEISFILNEEFTERICLNQTLVLVDDVITTGASYKAAYNVLKTVKVLPENIELWAGFHRQEYGC